LAGLYPEAFARTIPARRPFSEAWKENILKKPIRSFCIDFNMQVISNQFNFDYAAPGQWADADPEAHVDWYQVFGVNCIQSFVLSCNGYAWYKGGPVPEQPGLKYDFLAELASRAHEKKMLVFGYYPLDLNILYGEQHPEERYYQSVWMGIPKAYHIPFTTNYIDYVCASVDDVLRRTDIDGLLLDQVVNITGYVRGHWLECEQAMYREITGKPFPGEEEITTQEILDFRRWSSDRILYRICQTARKAKPECVLWINSIDVAYEFPHADWYLNEPMDLDQIRVAKERMPGRSHRYIQALAGWPSHDPRIVMQMTNYAQMDFYGFMELVDGSLPPPVEDYLSRPVASFPATDYLGINDRNVAMMIRMYQGKSNSYVTPMTRIDRVRKSSIPSQDWNALDQLLGRLNQGSPYPKTLAATGAFADLNTLIPLGGLTEYELNLPSWAGGANKRYWFAIPDASKTIGFHPTNAWVLPPDSVWIEHIEIETAPGMADSKRPLETRFLVLTTNRVHAFSYAWDDTRTNAVLVPRGGIDVPVFNENGTSNQLQVWHCPDRSACLDCHGSPGVVLGFNAMQLNRDHFYLTVSTNQLGAMNQAGFFSQEIPPLKELAAIAHPTNASFSAAYRVRCYLDINCSSCHFPGGKAAGFWDARKETPLAKTGILNGILQNPSVVDSSRVVTPGLTQQSEMFLRLTSHGAGRMPPHNPGATDQQAVQLLTDWIERRLISYKPPRTSFSQWQTDHFERVTGLQSGKLDDPDGDSLPNVWEWLFELDPHDPYEYERWYLHSEPSLEGTILWVRNVPNHGVEFSLESATNGSGPWMPIEIANYTHIFDPVGSTALCVVSNPPANTTFYRLRLFEPY
jgi:hypothetical protein